MPMIRQYFKKLPFILVVEDEFLVRTCISVELGHVGFDVVEAADAEEGLRKFEGDGRITTVFSDINMPGDFDGLSLAHKISRLRPEVQLILTSGRGEPPATAMPAGVYFLPKPYDCQFLAALINTA
jgi:DNA-binding NtrC family response regulator